MPADCRHWPWCIADLRDARTALRGRLRTALLALTRLRLLRDATARERRRWLTRTSQVMREIGALLDYMPALRRGVPAALRELTWGGGGRRWRGEIRRAKA